MPLPTYPSKVRAFRFPYSTEDAIRRLDFNASLDTHGLRRIPTVVPSRSREKPLGPSKTTPLYFPAWIIDFEARIKIKGGKSVLVQFYHSYMTGSDLTPINKLSLNPSPGPRFPSNPLEWDISLQSQYGSEIKCLPFNISPAAMVDKFYDANYFAAYPVLLPLYLMKYEGPHGSSTLILETLTNHVYSTRRLAELSRSMADDIPDEMKALQSLWRRIQPSLESFSKDVPTYADGALQARDKVPIDAPQIFSIPYENRSSRRIISHEVVGIWSELCVDSKMREATFKQPWVRPYDRTERWEVARWMSYAGKNRRIGNMWKMVLLPKAYADVLIINIRRRLQGRNTTKSYRQDVHHIVALVVEITMTALENWRMGKIPAWWRVWRSKQKDAHT